jgi:hypothetical protein
VKPLIAIYLPSFASVPYAALIAQWTKEKLPVPLTDFK